MFPALVLLCAVLAVVAPIAAIGLMASDPPPGSALDCYFRIRPWEKWRRHAVYRGLGVRQFKRAVMFYYDVVFLQVQRLVGARLFGQPQFTREAWRRVNGQHIVPGDASREAAAAACRRTRQFELIHVFILLPLLPIVAMLQATRHGLAAGVVGAVAVLTNAYPVLMQRYNRSRFESIADERGGEAAGSG